ncbi:MAG: sugar-binding transcriptional regulator [Glaciihabitans sp.]|nr:sugar-binding transcriptional regulator [Glaciihabitans sp.]MDQ1571055.1 deoxyribonucleoside regulator [Actinomycetota bacterium]
MTIATQLDNAEALTVRVAELYYEDDKTQDEIGTILGITRWKVGRLLSLAREQGIVRISIVHPRSRQPGLERQLRERFGLTDAVVVSDSASGGDLQDRVTRAAADYLTSLRLASDSLGVSWGKTLSAVADHLEDDWARAVSVVQVNGGVSLTTTVDTAAATAVTIARKGTGSAALLPSPAILERAETKRVIESDRTVAAVLALASRASVYLYSAGVTDGTSALVDSGYLTPGDLAQLVARGAVGDVVGRYINASGAIVDPELDERTIGLSLDQLRAAQTAIFVVAGAPKHDIARAVVSSGLCTVVVTDEATATALLSAS